jgi:hypothetical protein
MAGSHRVGRRARRVSRSLCREGPPFGRLGGSRAATGLSRRIPGEAQGMRHRAVFEPGHRAGRQGPRRRTGVGELSLFWRAASGRHLHGARPRGLWRRGLRWLYQCLPLAAASLGIAAVPQAAVAMHSAFVREFLKISDGRLVVAGIAFGLERWANTFRLRRDRCPSGSGRVQSLCPAQSGPARDRWPSGGLNLRA